MTGNQEHADFYDARYAQGYRKELLGYERARCSALEHFITAVVQCKGGTHVLDYGCGSGLHMGLWNSVFPGAELYCADISSVALEELAKKYPGQCAGICLITDNATHYDTHFFDMVVSVEVMEHVQDLRAYLSEVCRLLKPGGKFIWTTPCANRYSIEHLYSQHKKLIEYTDEGYRRWSWEDPAHLRRLTSREIEHILLETGFHDVVFRYRAHLFSFLCTRLRAKKIISRKLADALMLLDYKLLRMLPNAASMIGCAVKQ